MTPKTDTYGLNRAARNLALAKELADADAAPPLDPPFPFDLVRFPAAFFGVTEYSVEASDEQKEV